MNKFRFLEWNVYRDAQKLYKIVFTIVQKLPKEYRFEIGSQMMRSALSVILNIAEGSGKGSDKDFNRFLDISLGSLFEVMASVDTLKITNLVSTEEFETVFNICENIADQLGGFKKKLKKSYK